MWPNPSFRIGLRGGHPSYFSRLAILVYQGFPYAHRIVIRHRIVHCAAIKSFFLIFRILETTFEKQMLTQRRGALWQTPPFHLQLRCKEWSGSITLHSFQNSGDWSGVLISFHSPLLSWTLFYILWRQKWGIARKLLGHRAFYDLSHVDCLLRCVWRCIGYCFQPFVSKYL